MKRTITKLRDYYLQGLREEPTKRKIIDPILKKAGYDSREITSIEEEYETNTASGKVKIDRCLKHQGKPRIFLQAKPIGRTDLFKKDYTKTYKAALSEKVLFVVFTDGNRWQFYKVSNSQTALPPKPSWEIDLLSADQHFQSTLLQLLSQPRKGGVYFMSKQKTENREKSLGLRFWFEHTDKKSREFRENKVYQAILKAVERQNFQDFYPIDILQDIQQHNPKVLRELEHRLEGGFIERSIGSRLKQLVHRSILETKSEVSVVRQKKFGVNSEFKEEVKKYITNYLNSCTLVK